MIDFEVRRHLRRLFLANNKTMNRNTMHKISALAMMFAALDGGLSSNDNGDAKERVTHSQMIRSRSFNTYYNLSPRMAKARKLRKQLKKV